MKRTDCEMYLVYLCISNIAVRYTPRLLKFSDRRYKCIAELKSNMQYDKQQRIGKFLGCLERSYCGSEWQKTG
jgi:hypothetical protein